jgi:hypothetical protein
MMTFAAHYISQPLSSYYQDHRVLAEANLAVQKAFDLDILQVISDPYREAADFGLEVYFPYDDLPVAREPLLADPQDLQRLKYPDPGTGRRMSDRLEAIRYLHERLGGQVPIMGWVEGALAEAAGLRGMLNLMKDLTLRPEWVLDLLEWGSHLRRRKSRPGRILSAWGRRWLRKSPRKCIGNMPYRTKSASLTPFVRLGGSPDCISAETQLIF